MAMNLSNIFQATAGAVKEAASFVSNTAGVVKTATETAMTSYAALTTTTSLIAAGQIIIPQAIAAGLLSINAVPVALSLGAIAGTCAVIKAISDTQKTQKAAIPVPVQQAAQLSVPQQTLSMAGMAPA